MTSPRLLCLASFVLAGCSIQDSHIAGNARTRLLGMSEVDLESCLGVPDQHASFGTTDILTYYASSTSNSSFTVPIVGGIGFANGGYCHATFQLKDSRVTQILYSGEKNATMAPDAYCAPILRTCMDQVEQPSAPSPQSAKPTAAIDREMNPPRG
jgi:hypothetical protein